MKSLRLEPDPIQQLACVFNSAAGVGITFQVMAVTGQSTRNEHAVGTILEGSQDVQRVDPTAAEKLDDLDRSRVL